MATIKTVRTSGRKTTAAVLRDILNSDRKRDLIKTETWAEMLGCSPDTIRSVESGRGGKAKLTESLATRMFHETGISVSWLMAGDPKAPPVAANGEPYTREIFEKARAEKKWFDQQHPFLRNIDELGFCAQLVAILETANERKNYFMAAYNVGEALESLRNKFAAALNAQRLGPPAAATALKPLIEFGENFAAELKKRLRKQSSSKRPRRV